jgi:hypothetical protein
VNIKKLLHGIAILGIVVSILLTNTNIAAAAGCYGIGCKSRDPQLMGCWRDAKTVGLSPQLSTANAGWQEIVELRYSKICGTQWSRVTSRLSAKDISYTNAYVFDNPIMTRVTRYGIYAQTVWSKMWPGLADIGQACGNSVSKSDPSYKPTHCVTPTPTP